MIYLLILIYLILLPGTMIVMLYKIINKLDKMKTIEKQTQTKSVLKRRKHTNIKASSYNNVFAGRYDEYKNNKGLYEPQTPHKGVKLEKEV